MANQKAQFVAFMVPVKHLEARNRHIFNILTAISTHLDLQI